MYIQTYRFEIYKSKLDFELEARESIKKLLNCALGCVEFCKTPCMILLTKYMLENGSHRICENMKKTWFSHL